MDKFDIIASILDIANGNEITQVDILTKAKVPHILFKKYLFLLHQYGLIEVEYAQPQFRITYRITTMIIAATLKVSPFTIFLNLDIVILYNQIHSYNNLAQICIIKLWL